MLLIPAAALLLLAAHLFHAGLVPLALAAALLVGLLGVRRPWVARAVQVVLAIAVVEWLLTATTLARLRMQHDQPYLRLLLILGGVALFTALAALVVQHHRLRTHFHLDDATPRDTGA